MSLTGRGKAATAALAVASLGAAGAGAVLAAGADDAARSASFELHSEREFARAAVINARRSKFVLGVPRKRLDKIAECESHGDPKAIGGGGLYRGKYQFHRSTWRGMGGKGDPAKAPEDEQDRRAAMLLKASGSSPWPNCG